MNFLNVFEDRISSVLGSSSQAAAPFSFKKLAKEAVSQLKKETYEIDGQPVAPGLFTILISPSAERQLVPVYRTLAKEIRLFLQAQADRLGLRFLSSPVVRFMPDQELKRSKFFVFAENIDPVALDKVRAEEAAYLEASKMPGASEEPRPRKQNAGVELNSPEVDVATDADIVASAAVAGAGAAGAHAAHVAGAATPLAKRRASRAHEVRAEVPAVAATPAPRRARELPEALLIDRASGRTYPVLAPSTVIGRESANGAIALNDINVSRRHAEITYEHGLWMLVDLNSTNGTLVNNLDIAERAIHDGDLITVGLTNLEFKEV